MKKTTVAFLCVCTGVAILTNCDTEKEIAISGTLHNSQASSITINKQKTPVDTDGRFQYALIASEPGYYEIDYGKTFWIYLRPCDSAELEIDAEKDLSSLTYRGDRAQVNRFLIGEASESAVVNELFYKNFRDLVLLGEDAYRARMDEIWRPFNERLDRFVEEKSIRDRYLIKTQRAAQYYSWANIMIRYPEWHRQMSGDWEYQPSKGYYDFLAEADLNDPELLDTEEYKEFLERYLGYKTDELLETASAYEGRNYRPIRARMDVVLETFSEETIRSEMLKTFMPAFIRDNNHKGIDDLIAFFKQHCLDQRALDEIDKQLAEDKAIRDSCRIRVYKTAGDFDLEVFIYLPADLKEDERRPALAFFHGGGWDVGKPEWGQTQCEHFSALGMVAFSFEYRLLTRHGATPAEGMADAKSAIRWIRNNADEFGIDPDRIVGSGFSAGGHLTACTTMIDGFDEPGDDLSVSPAVNAMMFWVTPFKVLADGWFGRLLGDTGEAEDCDPDTHVRAGLPPSIIFQGTADDTVPLGSVKAFAEKMQAAGNRCDLHIYEGQTHLGWGENTKDVLKKMEAFLQSLGFLE